MRRARSSLTFVVFNIILSAAVAFAVIRFMGDTGETIREVPVTFEVRVTQPPTTPQVIIITTTPQGGEQPSRLTIPEEAREGDDPLPDAPVATVAAASAGDDDEAASAAGNGEAGLPENCIQYVIDEGDSPSAIASEFGVPLGDFMGVNELDEESATRLQIGQTVIVPLDGCPLLADLVAPLAPTITPSDVPDVVADAGADADADDTTNTIQVAATETPVPSPTVQATVTLAPTAENAEVAIVAVNGVGDITTESVEIANRGNIIDLTGWTITDGQGNIYTFPADRWLFSQASIIVSTGFGDDNALEYFWNRDIAVFQSGDVVVLADAQGAVQASLRIQ